MWHLCKHKCIIWSGSNRLRQIAVNLIFSYIKRSRKGYIANAIPPKIDMHQPRHIGIIADMPVVFNPLYQRRSTITDPNNSNTDFLAHQRRFDARQNKNALRQSLCPVPLLLSILMAINAIIIPGMVAPAPHIVNCPEGAYARICKPLTTPHPHAILTIVTSYERTGRRARLDLFVKKGGLAYVGVCAYPQRTRGIGALCDAHTPETMLLNSPL